MTWQEELGVDDAGEYEVHRGQITYRFRDASDEGNIVAEIEQESYAPVPKEGDRVSIEVSKADFNEDEQGWALTGSNSFGAMVVTNINYQYNYLFFERSAGPKGQRLLTTVEIWGEPYLRE